jgi:hypothetical protein
MIYNLTCSFEEEKVVFGLYEPSSFMKKKAPCFDEDWVALDIVLEGGNRVPPGVVSSLQELERAREGSREGHEVTLSHEEVLTLSESSLAALGFPPLVPQVSVSGSGLVTGDSFRLSIAYERSGGERIGAKRKGAFLFGSNEKARYRLSMPMYEIAKIEEGLDGTQDRDENFRAIAALNKIVPRDENVHEDGRLKSMHIYHASSFSLDVEIRQEDVDISPVLFESSRKVDTDDAIESEYAETYGLSELLPPFYQKQFAENIFRNKGGRKTYILEGDKYVFCDGDLKDALTVVHEKACNGTKEEKKAFIKNPKSFLRSELERQHGDEEKAELIADALFFEEYAGYSNRVVDVGVWEAPVLPWVQKSGETWIPDSDTFGIKVGDKYLQIEREKLEPFYDALKEAEQEGKENLFFKDMYVPVKKALEALSHLPKEVKSFGHLKKEKDAKEKGEGNTQRIVLIVRENFEDVEYKESSLISRKVGSFELPRTKNMPKPYQREGIEWLQESYKSGVSGVLLADDMGLGKTFQVLVFLKWLQFFCGGKPFLIVAPTGLLKVWEEENATHLCESLGEPGKLYASSGGELRHFREKKRGNDLEHGRATLNVGELRRKAWIVVSYETMRDYEHSLGQVGFGCVVFDEMQKVKNPAAVVTKAAKALNSDFYVGLTGTPVENRLADIHTISDILRPGFLGSLKNFSQRYEKSVTREGLEELKRKVEASENGTPPFMKRRLKSKELYGSIPKKHIDICKEAMPNQQAKAYQDVIRAYENSSDRGRMLEALQKLRSVSLHPFDPEQGHPSKEGIYGDDPEYFDLSARTKSTLSILQRIRDKGEKAIVFLDSKKLQPVLKKEIARRFEIRAPYIINGDMHVRNRQKAVDDFQSGDSGSFGVIILSPRAAGVGLTLTAANHVIHLSRWWNPAVEDQATDRAYRLGQEKDVYVHIPIAYHPDMPEGSSFDSRLDSLIEKKRALSGELLMPVGGADSERGDAEALYNNIFGGESEVEFGGSSFDDGGLGDVDRMGALEFEKWVATKFREAGYEEVGVPPRSDDGDVDIHVKSQSGREGFVQVKHTGSRMDYACDANPVCDLESAYEKREDSADYFVVTNYKTYNEATKSLAQERGVKLFDRGDLAKLSEKLRKL